MKKILILVNVLLLFSCGLVIAQDIEHVKKERMKNMYIAPSVGVELFQLSQYENEKNDYTIVYKGVPSVKYGFDVVYKHSEKVQVNTGVFYSGKTYDRSEYCNTCDNDYYYKSRFKNKYIETLIGATYNFVNGRADLGFYSNLNFSMLLSSKELRDTESGNKFEFDHKPFSNKFMSSIEPGLNFNYNLSYRLSLGFKTGYRVYFNSFETGKTFRNHSFVAQPGLFYKF